jgi:hypothetical protein
LQHGVGHGGRLADLSGRNGRQTPHRCHWSDQPSKPAGCSSSTAKEVPVMSCTVTCNWIQVHVTNAYNVVDTALRLGRQVSRAAAASVASPLTGVS